MSTTGGLPVNPNRLAGKVALLQGVIERRSSDFQGPGIFTAHAISRTSMQIDEAKATTQSLFMYYTDLDGTPKLVAVGPYTDAFAAAESAA